MTARRRTEVARMYGVFELTRPNILVNALPLGRVGRPAWNAVKATFRARCNPSSPLSPVKEGSSREQKAGTIRLSRVCALATTVILVASSVKAGRGASIC